jgi:hypothetical protein
MERFRIGRYPFNFQGDLLRDVVVKLNYNFSLIEDLLRQGGVSIDPDNLITINNIEKLIQVINDKISNELNYLVYVYYDGIYHFLSDIEFSDDKVNLIFEGSIIKDGKIVSSTYIITCDLDSEGNILNVTSENSKREYNISGFRVIRIRTKPLEFIDEEDLKLVGEALKDPSNSNSIELSIQDNSSTTNLIPHQSILSTIVSDNEIAHELKFITGENLITAKFTYNSNTKELIGSPSLTESLAPSSETLILSEINDIPSGGRISDENYNRLVLAIENNADIYTTDNTGLIKSVILISDTDNEIILTVKDNNLTEKNIIISKLNNLIKTEKVELATKESVDNKVDKEPGKGLSSNDYTSEEKTLVGTIINKVDKVQGKGLSTYDLTEARKNKLDSYPELTGAGNKALMDNGTFVEITGEGIIFSDIEIINIEDLQVEYVTEEIYNKIANAIINNRHIVLNSINRSDVSPFSLRAAEPINVITYSVIRQEYLNFTNRDIFLVITDGTTTTEITIESTFHVTIIKRPSSISLDNSNPLPTVELTQTSIGLQANLVLAKSDSGVQLVKTEDGLVAQFKWDGEDQEIKLKYVTSQEYSSLNEIDQGTLYFITDNRYIMFQGIKYGDNISREEINNIKESLNKKVDKEEGKGLSSNDYSDSDKSKVDKIITSGEGNKYLSDNGEYLEVKGGSFVWDMTFAEQENPNVTETGGIYTIYGALCQMYSNMSLNGDFAGIDFDKYPSFVFYPKFYTLDFWNKFIQAVKEGTPTYLKIHAGALTLGVGETKAYTAGEDVTVTEYNVLTSKGGALSTGETLDFYAGSEGAGGGIGNCTKGGIWYWFSNDGGVVVGNSTATHVTLRTAADQKLYHQITTGVKYEIITERGGQIGPLTISGNGSTPFVINNHNPDGTDIIQIFKVQGYNRFLVGWSETSGGPFIQRSSDNSCILIKSDGAYWGSSLDASAIKKLATQEWVLEQLEALKTS